MRLYWLSSLCLALASQPVRADENVVVPAYKPSICVEQTYRVRKSMETDMSLWFDQPGASSTVMRGNFRLKMTAMSQNEEGMRIRWSLDAALPPDTTELPGAFQLNTQYESTLATYGIRQLEVDTDLSGSPTSLVDVDRLLAPVRMKIDLIPPASRNHTIDAIDEKLRQDPLETILTALVPEANLLAIAHSHENIDMNIGHTWETSQVASIYGVSVQVSSKWTVAAIDMGQRIITFDLTETWDSENLTQATRATTDRLIASFGDRAKQLTEDQLASARKASKSRHIKSVVSLQNGETLEVSEVMTAQIGGMKMTAKTDMRLEGARGNPPK